MNFDLSEDQEALREGIRALCAGRFGMERVRAGFDASTFSELDETGVFSLRTDGFGWADAGIAFSELGRALVPGPLVWSHLAHGVVEGVVTGVELPSDGSGPIAIEHLEVADTVVVADTNGLRRLAPGSVSDARPVEWPLDPLTPVHLVDALPTGAPIGDAADALAWRRGGAVLTSAYQVGMATASVEAATAYALERRQFDRPIGSFQAVKHILADMVVRAELARAAVDAAAVTLDDPAVGDVDRAISGARILATEAALKNAKDSMQVHGGMGFTWEADVHLYLKRAWLLNTTFGTAAAHADALAAGLQPGVQ
ncbi:MAG TPA: acyl-CoA dehydrogenase [Acidimicrobiia bacterium]|nr:acyl-CoA dehydrogenase [Acidimicrobiia bacterium]